MKEKMLQILTYVANGNKTPKQAQKELLSLFNVSVLLFDFLYYVRNGTQDTPIKEIKDGIRTFLANYKR